MTQDNLVRDAVTLSRSEGIPPGLSELLLQLAILFFAFQESHTEQESEHMNRDHPVANAAVAEQIRKSAEDYRCAEEALKKAIHRWDYCKFNQRKGEVVFAGENLASTARAILKFYAVQDEELTSNPLAPSQVLTFKKAKL